MSQSGKAVIQEVIDIDARCQWCHGRIKSKGSTLNFSVAGKRHGELDARRTHGAGLEKSLRERIVEYLQYTCKRG